MKAGPGGVDGQRRPSAQCAGLERVVSAVGPAGGQGDAGVAEGVGDAAHGVEDGPAGSGGIRCRRRRRCGCRRRAAADRHGWYGTWCVSPRGADDFSVREVRGGAGRSRLPPSRCCRRCGGEWWTAAPVRAGPLTGWRRGPGCAGNRPLAGWGSVGVYDGGPRSQLRSVSRGFPQGVRRGEFLTEARRGGVLGAGGGIGADDLTPVHRLLAKI